MLALEDIRTNGLRMLGTCVGARAAREQFLQEKIDHEATTVAKLINLPHQHALLVLRDTDPSRLANKHLAPFADHKVRHRPTSNLPFHPIVLSLGGMMNGSTTKVLASWKQVMTRGTYNLMLKRLSLCLLQARVRSFEL
ncbi:hypothetical protein EHS25_000929 [Saitozyma podzolica]|uniref:Uncharacterized protein n=1 Tax=Saitozyma podzolica TaxID=1890683 RepID=A0A427YXM8_9TREE|nr:hypothetical protein EHS25_000929 [Saitozyma podzolica]